MIFPVLIPVGPLRLHPHLMFETLAYAIAFQVYLASRRRSGDALDDPRRWWVIAAAAMGAVVGSRILYLFEDPQFTAANWTHPDILFDGKTIVGGLIGGLFAVELVKRRLGILRRTGDLFALPLCVGIAIGRIGCFLTGLSDRTSGIMTSLPWAVDFGDGVLRHPTQLYESVFAAALGIYLWRRRRRNYLEGDLFKIFMVAYFSFRLVVDYLKPDVRIFLGLSAIQLACVLMLAFYSPDILRWLRIKKSSQGDMGPPQELAARNL